MVKAFDYLVIGAGPGGLQLGYFLEKSGRDYLILEAEDHAGHFFKAFPRHRKLLSINKVFTGSDDEQFNLRYDWNSLLSDEQRMLFKRYSKDYFPDADDLVEYLGDFAAHFALNIRYGTRVARVSRVRDWFHVHDEQGAEVRCRYLVVATGASLPYVPAIPGIEHVENYNDVSIDPDDFANQRVLIIGKGNSGFETAENLLGTTASIHLTSPHNLKLAWKTHHVGHLRAVNNNFLDTYLLKAQNGTLDAQIEKIEPREDGKLVVTFDLNRAHGDSCSHLYDRVILCSGFTFDGSWFDETCKPELAINGRFPALTSRWESTNVPNLYFAGTLMQARDFKKTQSSFIHGFRYNVRALFRMFEMDHHEQPWPSRKLALTAEAITGAILDRINRSSALWHQTGFLCDYLAMHRDEDVCLYYDELPSEFVGQSDFGRHGSYFTVSLEYGPDYPEFPFEFDRFVDAGNAHLNPQLHPVIRHCRGSEVVAVHHMLEEIEGRWVERSFIDPLLEFVGARIEKTRTEGAVEVGQSTG